MVEALGRAIKKYQEEGKVKGIKLAKVVSPMTHHQFVDDTILIGKAQERKVNSFKKVLKYYEKASHKRINL